eukprot:724398-Rhodomonas_salina.2
MAEERGGFRGCGSGWTRLGPAAATAPIMVRLHATASLRLRSAAPLRLLFTAPLRFQFTGMPLAGLTHAVNAFNASRTLSLLLRLAGSQPSRRIPSSSASPPSSTSPSSSSLTSSSAAGTSSSRQRDVMLRGALRPRLATPRLAAHALLPPQPVPRTEPAAPPRSAAHSQVVILSTRPSVILSTRPTALCVGQQHTPRPLPPPPVSLVSLP